MSAVSDCIDPALPQNLKGESFCALLGSHTSALELFILKRKIMGPSWLKISNFSISLPSQRVSWCKFEVTVESPKVITVLVPEEKVVHPPAVVTAINLKTIVNETQNISEIVSASLLCFHNAKIDVPMAGPERKRCGILSHFTVVRNPEGTGYPIGWKKEMADRNSKKGCCVLSFENRYYSAALLLWIWFVVTGAYSPRKLETYAWLRSFMEVISNNEELTLVQVSWCKFEVTVESPKVITVLVPEEKVVHPPAVVTAINLKTIVNETQNISEIVSASLLCFHNAKIDVPMAGPERKRCGILSHFTVVRNPEGTGYPIGWKKEMADRNSKKGCCVLSFENSERALLNRLFVELNKLDSDVLVGHNISRFDLDGCKVLSSMWSKIGRLKRSFMPRLKGNNKSGLMSCIAGRLLCDTDLCSQDLLKQQVSYSLTDLSKTQLNQDRKQISPNDIPKMFQSSKTLVELIECGERDAWLSMELMFHLSVLPLTLQLTNISGNLWGKTLQGSRAQRIEYYLLHTFQSRKYILPDKISQRMKDIIKSSKRRISHGELDAELALENDPSKKGPGYAGGLVLEPKKGLYDKYVLLLDFNSLYPSIIQEYNICFTTVPRSEDGVPRLPSSQTPGILPKLMEHLVSIRKRVKQKMKKETGLKYWELDIRQQALKLTANSIYGCLGFSDSRFYAKPLAELITLQGREILQRTVDLVQNHLNLEVIYGDTDSIMIHSGLDDIEEVKTIITKVIQEVNKKYRCLKIDCDGIYKRMLILRKKKYAGVKLQFKDDGETCEEIERKGVDMVRRDWSILSKEIGDLCLAKIFYGGSCEDVVEAIHNELVKIKEEMRNGQVALEKYDDFWQLVKEDKLQKGDFEEYRALIDNAYGVNRVLQCREDSNSRGVSAKHPHPPNPDNVRIDRHANNNVDRHSEANIERQPSPPIDRCAPITYRVQMPKIDEQHSTSYCTAGCLESVQKKLLE
ncbi:hypothetical protein F2Q70_00018211 [Brassica cretica]|uniref:DNA polymerase n=1 Tax=Brassica cretica TaxID=69181 RepID=A0A8S9HZA3_BRACR|nr:hypothetical protein F2Q70_00018211 [Brassica cretica]